MPTTPPTQGGYLGLATDGILADSTEAVEPPAPPEPTRRLLAPPRFGRDLVLPASPGAVHVTPSGDWPAVQGRPNLRAAIRRRAVTVPGDMVHRPEYGGGLPLFVERLNDLGTRTRAALAVRDNALRDPRVEDVGVSVREGDPGQTIVELQIRFRGETEAEVVSVFLNE